jgi:hypothetical protein
MTQKNLSRRPMYPSTHAFVLRLHSGADLAADRYLGCIEQVASGERVQFESLDELLGFLRARMGAVDESESGEAGDGEC